MSVINTGKIAALEELRAKVPPELPGLLRLPGVGPKTVALMWKEAHVTDMASLAEAVKDGRLEKLHGMGAKKIQQIAESMEFVASAAGRTPLGLALPMAQRLAEVVAALDRAQQVSPAGSVRRGRETVGDLDILCQADSAKAEALIQAFVASPEAGIVKVLGAGGTKASVRLEHDVQADLRVVPAESYGAALQYFTGSKEHNIRLRELAVKKGWKLNEYGLFEGDRRLAGATEQEVYQRLGLAYVPPELREDRGEIEAALAGELPDLVALDDIRGDLHMHTTASDGLETIEAMIAACLERGYQYMAISDHSKAEAQAHGLDEARLAKHRQAVAKAASASKGIDVYFCVRGGHLQGWRAGL